MNATAIRRAGLSEHGRIRAIGRLARLSGDPREEVERRWEDGETWCSVHGWRSGRDQLPHPENPHCRTCHYAGTRARMPRGPGSRAATARREWRTR